MRTAPRTPCASWPAKVELRISNPAQALITRDGQDGVFVLARDGKSVVWRPVNPGVRQDERAQVTGEGLVGRVVTLGQQLLDEGSAVSLPAAQQADKP